MYQMTCPYMKMAAPPSCHYCAYPCKYFMYPEIPEGCEMPRHKPIHPAPQPKTNFTREDALRVAKQLGIDWSKSPFDVEQFRTGMNVELEHGRRDPATNVTGDDPILTGKIALAHLKEFPDYYTRLKKLEDEAKAYWGAKK